TAASRVSLHALLLLRLAPPMCTASATPEIYTLSLHDALPISALEVLEEENLADRSLELGNYMMEELRKISNPKIKEIRGKGLFIDRKSTRLNSSHVSISYAVFCLKKKINNTRKNQEE